jgi:hypothetical protein
MPTALDPSARENISSIHSKEKLHKPTNLSAVLGLHSTSCFKANANLHVTKLRQMIQAKLRRNQVTPATIRNDSFKLIDMLASEGAKASIRQSIVTLTFEQSIKLFPIFQLIDVSVPNENNSCSVFQMVANGHNTFIESNSFNDDSLLS